MSDIRPGDAEYDGLKSQWETEKRPKMLVTGGNTYASIQQVDGTLIFRKQTTGQVNDDMFSLSR